MLQFLGSGMGHFCAVQISKSCLVEVAAGDLQGHCVYFDDVTLN